MVRAGRSIGALVGLFLLAAVPACSDDAEDDAGGNGTGGGGDAGSAGTTQATPEPAAPDNGAPLDPGAACAAGTTRCGESEFCCPDATECLETPSGQYCDTGFCCVGCPGGLVCGAGCCPSGTECSANNGGDGCSGELCCTTAGDPPCPGEVASQCPTGTSCSYNRSARACTGSQFACYTAAGRIGCPGEVACPNGEDFCPAGLHCLGLPGGVCLQASTSSGYCCRAAGGPGETCDEVECDAGLICVTNPLCPDTDPNALNVCRTIACGENSPVDCGNYCCASEFPSCAGDCFCNP